LPGEYIGDAMRRLHGKFSEMHFMGSWQPRSELIVRDAEGGYAKTNSADWGFGRCDFDSSRVVPTAEENRPASISCTVLMSY